MQQILDDLFLFEDTCNVYVVRSGSEAVLIDFGAGAVLGHLSEIGVERVTDVMITHHHRDQAQGLPLAVEAGIRIWVPHTEQELFTEAEAHWQTREIYNNYNMRQDRFSLLESVPINGTLQDYEHRTFGNYRFEIVPTPGHTIGSITLIAEINETRVAFSGDLIAGPGQVWSMAATQWTYNGAEGVGAIVASLLDLRERAIDLLLPSHGEAMHEPNAAMNLLVERFWKLLRLRSQILRLFEMRERPYEPITPHLLRHRACVANTYVLISESKKALLIDFGYDFTTGLASGSDRASRRPWLYTIPTLKRQFGIEKIDVVMPTHFHDDHVAGFNLLRQVEGTEVWAAELFSDILEHPARYDLPCLWYDPIPVDRALPLETQIQWEEYTFTLYPLPGHTFYAVAIAFEVDGKRILATGDQYQGNAGLELNYVYANRFEANDYVKSAELYRRLKPDIILTGHWLPLHVTPEYLDRLSVIGAELEQLHREVRPEKLDFGEEGFLARLIPYQTVVADGEAFDIQAQIRNPFQETSDAIAQMVLPKGWQVVEAKSNEQDVPLEDNKVSLCLNRSQTLTFHIIPSSGRPVRRARIALDLTIGGRRFGQQAEALVTVT